MNQTQNETTQDQTQPSARAEAPEAKKRMDKWVKIIFLLVVVGVVVYIQYSQRKGPVVYGWSEDLPATIQRASRQNLPVLVFFMSRPAGEADHFIVKTLKNNKAAIEESKCLLVQAAVTGPSSELAVKYKLADTPVLMLLDSQGNEIARRTDRVGETDLPIWLKQSLAGKK
ncbi:MAG: hypothetical protein GXY38_08335 [Planctomycetes bacterium]|nr:hypothetical protein [Planctomycetota bacterium]